MAATPCPVKMNEQVLHAELMSVWEEVRVDVVVLKALIFF